MKSKMIEKTPCVTRKENYTELTVLIGPAGWYVGTMFRHFDADGNVDWSEPGSRDSGYFQTKEAAELFLSFLETGWEPDLAEPHKLQNFMSQAQNEAEWDHLCQIVKAHFGGYPDFWFNAILRSGLMEDLVNSWGTSAPDAGAERPLHLRTSLRMRQGEEG